MASRRAWKRKHFTPQVSRKVPHLPISYIPHVCNDKELYELLERIEVTPQREVACLNEWNRPMDLEQMYRANYNLREHLLCDSLALARLKTNKQIACLLLNPGMRFFQPVETALRWAVHLKVPVVTVPRLKMIMKDRIGVEAQMVGIRKNPQIALFQAILKKVKEITKEFPVLVPQPKKKPAKKTPAVPVNPVKKTPAVPVNPVKKTPALPVNPVKKTPPLSVNPAKKIQAAGSPKKAAAGKTVLAKKKPALKENEEPDSESESEVIHDTFPYTTFRPVVTDADGHKIKKLLLGLPYLHVGKSSIWHFLKGQTYPEIRSQLILDRTPICALIRRKQAGCVLISASGFEKLNMKKLVHICLLEDIPVLIVPGLNQTMLSATALRVNSIGIFKLATDPLLDKILKTVRFIAKRYPCPKFLRDKFQGFMVDYGKPILPKRIKAVKADPEPGKNQKADVPKVEIKPEEVKAAGEKTESVVAETGDEAVEEMDVSGEAGDEVVEGMDATATGEPIVEEEDEENVEAEEDEAVDENGEAEEQEGAVDDAQEETQSEEVAPVKSSDDNEAVIESGDSKVEPAKDSKG